MAIHETAGIARDDFDLWCTGVWTLLPQIMEAKRKYAKSLSVSLEAQERILDFIAGLCNIS